MGKPDNNFSQVIGSKRYSVETATLIADDLYWDDRTWHRNGCNTFLYRTPKGAFFTVTTYEAPGPSEVHPNRRPLLKPLSLDEAIEAYNSFPKKQRLPFAEAFPGVAITDA